jgi:uncharacterized integral membrane protein
VSRRGNVALRIGLGLAGVLLLAWFAHAHAGQSVTLRFGLFTLRSVSLPLALYGAVIVGMLIVLGVGLRGDLRARRRARPPHGARTAPEGGADPSRGAYEKAERRG